jgi:site-specific DNA-adenine methylase
MSAEKVFLQGGGNEWDFVNRSLQKGIDYMKADLAKSRALKQQKARETLAKPNIKPSVGVKSILHSKAKQAPHTTTPTVGATDTTIPRNAPQRRSTTVPTAVKFENLPKATAPIFNGAMKAITATGDKQLIQEVNEGVDTNVPLPAPVEKAVIKTMNDLGIPADVSNDIVLHVSDPIDDIPEVAVATTEGETEATSVLSPTPLAPFICRVGTKADIAVWITKHMTPKALNTYVEPFIGGGAIYLVKSRAKREAINDWNYTIFKSWEDLKKSTPAELLKDWNSDKLLRSYVRTVSEFSSENPEKSLNLKKWINDNMKVKDSKEQKNFDKLDKATWESKLNGNRIRYIPDADGVPSASKPKTLSYTDLKEDKKGVKFGVEEATILYKIYRALKNLLDKGKGNEVDVGLYVGGAKKAPVVKEKNILQKLKDEALPKTTLQEWLKGDFEEIKNPDPEAIEGEKNVLKAKTQLSQLIYEKLRSCGGFSGSGVITSTAFIKHRNGEAKSPLKKVAISSTIGFLLEANGGLQKYNERLKNTDIKNGHWYNLVKPFDSPNTFFMLDPPYQATGGYGNKYAFNFEAFVKSINGIKDPRGDGANPKIQGDVLVTINGGDKVLALFRKYARQSKITWYGLKVYVRQ